MSKVTAAPADAGTASRSEARSLVVIRCEVRQGSGPWQMVVLEDLSTSGFRISGLRNFVPGRPVAIRLGGFQPLTAMPCWQTDRLIGCEFAAPLHIAVFDHLVRQARLL